MTDPTLNVLKNYYKGDFEGMTNLFRTYTANVKQQILNDIKNNAHGLVARVRIDVLFQLSRRLI